MQFDATNTFCISLYGTPRWDRMVRRFEHVGLQVTRWKASTPNTISDSFAPNLRPTQKACAQSHINIWKHTIRTGLPYVFILEDDAMFRVDWRERLSELSLDSDPNWDGIFLNASEPLRPVETWQPAREQVLAAGYILSNRGAKKLLERWKNCYSTSDWMTCCLQNDGHCYTYFPWLIIQEGRESTIGSGVDADHEKVVRCLSEVGYSLSNYV